MGTHCCGHAPDSARDARWRRALWVALGLNGAMFGLEWAAGAAADSRALHADALDFFADAANYAISLGVAGLALGWRARAALLKGTTLVVLGLWVLGSCIHALLAGTQPEPFTMGAVGVLALLVNAAVALMLYRFRAGDANMRSVWICSRNDAIGNVAVVLAALGVFGTGRALPDILVAAVMAGLGLTGGWRVVQLARAELRTGRSASAAG
ncbi:MAG: Cobalt-zinc-cadmium resistance protein CzcD [uncultured Sphingomonadaceae bacterium]|uniref:Cobalt-zinc-cadmium resistance protein CzcD n=1 Tax=uncultured Sphingomonadaceae bacterium TaxID=169976 RepID=A0A6J4RY92_9SPHN|nr:MAG: Cobalt-zinc-cadmium resistance protein CzcD [uncultured Sphingomonadaceae bacterium]